MAARSHHQAARCERARLLFAQRLASMCIRLQASAAPRISQFQTSCPVRATSCDPFALFSSDEEFLKGEFTELMNPIYKVLRASWRDNK